jgi:hypothetical protein
VTTQDGETASQAITVTSSGTEAPFTVSIDEPDGIAPHTVTISVSGGGTPVATVEFDVDGNGTVDLTSPGIPAAGVEATYSGAGTATPRVTFKDASGTVLYTTTKQVHIVDPADKYNLAKMASGESSRCEAIGEIHAIESYQCLGAFHRNGHVRSFGNFECCGGQPVFLRQTRLRVDGHRL